MPIVAWSPSTRTHSSVSLYLRFAGSLRFAINRCLPSECCPREQCMPTRAQFIAPLLSFIKWQRYDLRCGAFSTYVDMDCFANNGMRSFDIAHANVLVECRTRRPAGKEADLLIIFINSIATTAYTAFNHLVCRLLLEKKKK